MHFKIVFATFYFINHCAIILYYFECQLSKKKSQLLIDYYTAQERHFSWFVILLSVLDTFFLVSQQVSITRSYWTIYKTDNLDRATVKVWLNNKR